MSLLCPSSSSITTTILVRLLRFLVQSWNFHVSCKIVAVMETSFSIRHTLLSTSTSIISLFVLQSLPLPYRLLRCDMPVVVIGGKAAEMATSSSCCIFLAKLVILALPLPPPHLICYLLAISCCWQWNLLTIITRELVRDTSDVWLCHHGRSLVVHIFYFLMFRISDVVQSSSSVSLYHCL